MSATRSLPHDYAERVYAGVLGKIIGVYLGRPFEQWSHEAIESRLGEIRYYVHDKLGVPLVVTDDDISGTFTFLRAFQDYGYDPNLTSEQIGESWLNYIIENRTILWWGGMGMSTEHTAYLRLKHGMKAPHSGSIATNGATVAEQIGAQIFIDGWGLINPNDPARAVDFARRAGSVSHDGEAIYGAQVIAAMEALAFGESDIDKLIDGALGFIPSDSTIARLIADLREWHATGEDWRAGLRKLQAKYGYEAFGGGCHMVPNHAVIIHALLHGAGDFNESMMIVNTCGYDTDCNSGNLGCLLGIRGGLATFEGDKDWRGPVADRLYLPTADGGRGVSDAVRESVEIVNAGRALAGLEPWNLKNGSRFHFSFPGSIQGFEADTPGTTIENIELEDGSRALKISTPGGTVRVTTPTFVQPDMRDSAGYRLIASPTLYPGQPVFHHISVPAQNDGPFNAETCFDIYDAEDKLAHHAGHGRVWEPGVKARGWTKAPQVGSFPIARVGLEIKSEQPATVILHSLTWKGAPTVTFGQTEKGKAWRDAWVDGMDHFERWGEPFRLIQDEGTGLIIQGTREWQDYSVRSTITFHMVERAGIAARAQGMRRWIALFLCRDGFVRLVRSLDGEAVLAEAPFAWSFEESYELRIDVKGCEYVGFVNGVQAVQASDDSFTGGGVAFVVTEGRIGAHEIHIEA